MVLRFVFISTFRIVQMDGNHAEHSGYQPWDCTSDLAQSFKTTPPIEYPFMIAISKPWSLNLWSEFFFECNGQRDNSPLPYLWNVAIYFVWDIVSNGHEIHVKSTQRQWTLAGVMSLTKFLPEPALALSKYLQTPWHIPPATVLCWYFPHSIWSDQSN